MHCWRICWCRKVVQGIRRYSFHLENFWTEFLLGGTVKCVQVESFIGEAKNNRLERGYWLIWQSVIWVLWKARIEKIFKNSPRDVMILWLH